MNTENLTPMPFEEVVELLREKGEVEMLAWRESHLEAMFLQICGVDFNDKLFLYFDPDKDDYTWADHVCLPPAKEIDWQKVDVPLPVCWEYLSNETRYGVFTPKERVVVTGNVVWFTEKIKNLRPVEGVEIKEEWYKS